MKKCTKCSELKENFGKHKHTADGLASWCRDCKNVQSNKKKDEKMLTKLGHVTRILSQRKTEAKKQNVVFEIDKEYALSIAGDICPVLGMPLSWCERKGKATDNSPSLDKFDPKLGYVPGNVAWISFLANTIKSNATVEQIESVANWMRKTQCST